MWYPKRPTNVTFKKGSCTNFRIKLQRWLNQQHLSKKTANYVIQHNQGPVTQLSILYSMIPICEMQFSSFGSILSSKTQEQFFFSKLRCLLFSGTNIIQAAKTTKSGIFIWGEILRFPSLIVQVAFNRPVSMKAQYEPCLSLYHISTKSR